MGSSFDALTAEGKAAVEWKARQNLAMALADGNERAQANQKKFLENNRESLANNSESVRLIIDEYKNFALKQDDD